MNLLITGAWTCADQYIEKIKENGHDIAFLQQEQEKLPCSYEWVEGIVCNGLFLTHPIEQFINLKYVQLTSAGYDRVPMQYIEDHEIEIHNAHGVYSIPIAEYVLTGVLNLYKHIDYFRNNQKEKVWEKHRGLIELSGKTVCIVGCGSIGNECAKRFQAFGCKVIGINRSIRSDANYSLIAGMNQMDKYLSEADIVVLTVPLTKETVHLINEDRLAVIRDNTVLVNVARGTLIDEQKLMNHIDRFGGVVLDVFEEEPLKKDSPLWAKKNVIITPHNSFVGNNNQKRLDQVILKNLGI